MFSCSKHLAKANLGEILDIDVNNKDTSQRGVLRDFQKGIIC